MDFLVRLGLNFHPMGELWGRRERRLGFRHFFVTDEQKRDYLSHASQLARGVTKNMTKVRELWCVEGDDTDYAAQLLHAVNSELQRKLASLEVEVKRLLDVEQQSSKMMHDMSRSIESLSTIINKLYIENQTLHIKETKQAHGKLTCMQLYLDAIFYVVKLDLFNNAVLSTYTAFLSLIAY